MQKKIHILPESRTKERLPRNRRDIWSLSEYRTDKYSQSKSIIWSVWQNGWVFAYELSDCGFEYRCLLSHIVLCLNAFAELRNVRGASRQPVLMGNFSTCLYVLAYQSTEWLVISPLQVVCRAWDSVAMRQLPFEKKIDTKYMQVNELRNIVSMTKKAMIYQLTRLVGSVLMR